MRRLILGTRGSKLALAQSEMIAAVLREAHPGLEVTLEIIVTKGDRVLDVALSAVGDKGLFVKELETALLEHTVDLAVHSGKDLPSMLPEGLTLAAFPHRADPRDVIILPDTEQRTVNNEQQGAPAALDPRLSVLPQGARVGTSSLRRACQLRALRPDLQLLDVRGNVDTRLRKLAEGQFDAIILAAAGLQRLHFLEMHGSRLYIRSEVIAQASGPQLPSRLLVLPLPPQVMLSAVAQGALAIEARADDQQTLELLAVLDDPATRAAALAERAFLRRLEGGCQVPIAAYAELAEQPGQLVLRGLVGAIDGSSLVQGSLVGSIADPEPIGTALAEDLLARGAGEILAGIVGASAD